MNQHSNSCLYGLWQAESAPMYHMSAFWPMFDETHVMQFVRGDAPSPEMSRGLSVESAAAAQAKIERFLNHIADYSPEDYPCLPAYQAFERERLAAFEMIAHAADPAAIAQLNDELYGQLPEMLSDQALGHLYQHIAALEPASDAVSQARDLVMSGLADAPHDGSVEPQFDAINRYRLKLRPLVERRFGFVQELLDATPGETLESEAVGRIIDATLERVLGPGKDGWKAGVTKGAPNVFINYHHREVTIPAGRQYTKSHIDTLAVHEIGVHVQRSVNGSRSAEPLAGLGLAGYGPAEEAFGVLLGNATKQTYHQINSLIPFAVIHYADSEPRPTFRQVFEFARALIICLANPTADELKSKRHVFGRAAFSRTIRVLRLGTNELIERSTTKYWRGQLLLMKYFDDYGLTDTSFNDFFAGKYDCLNPAQLTLIQTHSSQSSDSLVKSPNR